MMIDWEAAAETADEKERFLFLSQWADAREELGLPGADGLRWLAANRRWPQFIDSYDYYWYCSHLRDTHHRYHDWLPFPAGHGGRGENVRGGLGRLLLEAALGYERFTREEMEILSRKVSEEGTTT